MSIDLAGLARDYLDALAAGFHTGRAPDGTPVVSTPYRFATGDPLEIAAWEESGRMVLSDRGGLANALLLAGIDVLESDVYRSQLSEAVAAHGAQLDGCTILRPAEPSAPGQAVQDLIRSVMDAQVAGYRAFGRAEERPESGTYALVRRVLDTHGARYREEMRVSGASRRRYLVDFKLAFRPQNPIMAILVVARDRTLELAERWNFRFRDIRAARHRLQRLFVVDEEASWSRDAQTTIEPECEAVFPPGQADGLGEYLRSA